jgi:high-affinity nickel-transport protein
MEGISLFILVFVLGLRHGLDADHLAYIDGQTRYNMDTKFGRWVGALFSFGHGSAVIIVAGIIAFIGTSFTMPDYLDVIGTWVSIISLFVIGTINVISLIKHPQAHTHEHFALKGLKGRFVPKFLQQTRNPFVIILVGLLFAFAADTVSITSVWAIAALPDGVFMPLILGFVFLIGMMITDTIDSLITHQILAKSNNLGKIVSQVMGWLVVLLSYGVCIYDLLNL